MAMGFMAWGMSDWWLELKRRQRAIFLFTTFALLSLTGFLDIGFSEKGAYLTWLPVCLVLYLDLGRHKILYGVSGLLILFSNKTSTILAYLSILIQRFQRIVILLVVASLSILGLFFKGHVQSFFEASINSRAFIWLSSLKGLIASPIWGHGFKTFIIDYPEYKIVGKTWGTVANQQIAHGHSLLFNYLFELGIVGLILMTVFFYLVYKRARPAFIPLLVLSFLDIPISMFGEFLLAALILGPFFQNKQASEDSWVKMIITKVPQKSSFALATLAYVLVSYSFVPSAIGHFYYDTGDYTQAIKWDSKQPLYYLLRGIESLDSQLGSSLKDFKKAVELTPNIGYLHGYLAAARFTLHRTTPARESIDTALKLSGTNSYWHFIAALTKFKNEKAFNRHFNQAMKVHPEIIDQVRDSKLQSSVYIGSKSADVRVLSFFRKGPKMFMPRPYLPNCPTEGEDIRQLLLKEYRARQEFLKSIDVETQKLKKKSKSQAES